MNQIEHVMGQSVWAVVGATPRQEKFGYKIFRRLLDCGKIVYPIHPFTKEIDGVACYQSLDDLPERPQVVNIVVGAAAGKRAFEACARMGIPTVWLQPGADDAEVVEYAEKLGLKVIRDCVLTRF